MGEETLKDKTAKGLFWGGFSNGIQQMLSLGFGIFLSRILSPSDYGVVGMLAIFTGIGNIIQDSGFSIALTNKQNIKHEDYNSVFWFNIVVGLVIYIILFCSAPLIASFFKNKDLIWVSRIVFLSFLFGSFGTAQAAYLFKNLKAKERAKVEIFSLLLSNAAALIMALNGMAYWGIAIQSSLYIGLSTLFRWFYSPWRPTLSFNITPLKEMFSFSMKVMLTGIFSQITMNIMSVLLGKYYTEQQVGYYSQANKWTLMGGGIITGMLTGIAQPVLAQVTCDVKRQLQVLRKLIRFTAFISFPAMFGLALVSKELILITVTDKWILCVPIMQILCVWGAFSPICELYKNAIISKGKSDIYLWVNLIFGIVQLFLLLFMVPYGILWMVVAYVVSYFGYFFIWCFFAYKLVAIHFFDLIYDVMPYFFITLIALGGGFLVTLFIENLYWVFILKILLSSSLYILIMWLTNSIIFKEVVGFLLKKVRC